MSYLAVCLLYPQGARCSSTLPGLPCVWGGAGKPMANGHQCFLEHQNAALPGFISDGWIVKRMLGSETGSQSLGLQSTSHRSCSPCYFFTSLSFSFFVYKTGKILTQLISKEIMVALLETIQMYYEECRRLFLLLSLYSASLLLDNLIIFFQSKIKSNTRLRHTIQEKGLR